MHKLSRSLRQFGRMFTNPVTGLAITTYEMPDGKLEQFLVIPGR